MNHCPVATQDPELNAANQARTVEQFGYGPHDPSHAPPGWWEDKARRWGLPLLLAPLRRCGNCSAFDVSVSSSASLTNAETATL